MREAMALKLDLKESRISVGIIMTIKIELKIELKLDLEFQ